MYLPAVAKLSFKPTDRAGRTRLLALCWIGFVLVFFTFSTTQEYYSMPCYPALALAHRLGDGERRMCGSGAAPGCWRSSPASPLIAAFAFIGTFAIFHAGRYFLRAVPHPSAYTLSLGHMLDLTLGSFAYLRVPLAAGRHSRSSSARWEIFARKR